MRMGRLLFWAQIAKDWGDLELSALTTLQNQWERFITMLQKVNIDNLPTPVLNLIRQSFRRRAA